MTAVIHFRRDLEISFLMQRKNIKRERFREVEVLQAQLQVIGHKLQIELFMEQKQRKAKHLLTLHQATEPAAFSRSDSLNLSLMASIMA